MMKELKDDVIIEIKNLKRSFGKKQVLNNINLDIKKGKIYALVGNNGVGKTTLLKIMCGMLTQSEGTVVVEKGVRIGCLIEEPGIFSDLSAYSNLKAKSICLGLKSTKEELNAMLELVGLGDVRSRRVGKFSMGMKQRLGIALALLGDPDLLIFDEPVNSLDPHGIVDFRKIILDIFEKTGKPMIISSHNLDELEKVATDIIVLNRGEMIRNCTKEDFIKECGDTPIDEYFVSLCC